MDRSASVSPSPGALLHQNPVFGDGKVANEGLYAMLQKALGEGNMRAARQKVTKDGLGGNGAWTEMKSTVADAEGQSSCRVCGKAGELSKCGGCRRVW